MENFEIQLSWEKNLLKVDLLNGFIITFSPINMTLSCYFYGVGFSDGGNGGTV